MPGDSEHADVPQPETAPVLTLDETGQVSDEADANAPQPPPTDDAPDDTSDVSAELQRLQSDLDELGTEAEQLSDDDSSDASGSAPPDTDSDTEQHENPQNDLSHHSDSDAEQHENSQEDFTPEPTLTDAPPDDNITLQAAPMPPIADDATLQDEEPPATADELDAMRRSNFASMVMRSRDLPDEEEAHFGSKTLNSFQRNSEAFEAGLNAASLLANGHTLGTTAISQSKGLNNLAPTEAERTITDRCINVLKGALVVALAIKRMVILASAPDASAGLKIVQTLPTIFKLLSATVGGISGALAKNSQLTNNIVNTTTALSDMLEVVEMLIDYHKLSKQLNAFEVLKNTVADPDGAMQARAKSISSKRKQIAAMLVTGSLQAVGELLYTLSYWKHPNTKATMYTRIATSAMSITHNGLGATFASMSAYNQGAANKVDGAAAPTSTPSEQIAAHAYTVVANYRELYSPEYFLGDGDHPEHPPDEREAYQKYHNFEQKMDFYGLSHAAMDEAKSKEAQDSLIKDAVGY